MLSFTQESGEKPLSGSNQRFVKCCLKETFIGTNELWIAPKSLNQLKKVLQYINIGDSPHPPRVVD